MAKSENKMTVSAVPTRRMGRPLRPGALCVDKHSPGLKFFVDYCPGCQSKVFCDRYTLDILAKRASKNIKSLRYRIIKALVNKYRIYD